MTIRLHIFLLVMALFTLIAFGGFRLWRTQNLPSPSELFVGNELSWPQINQALSLNATDPANPGEVNPNKTVYLRSLEQQGEDWIAIVDPVTVIDCNATEQSLNQEDKKACRWSFSSYVTQNLPNQTTTYKLATSTLPYVVLRDGRQHRWQQLRLPFIQAALQGTRIVDDASWKYRSIRFWNPDPDTNDSGLSLFDLYIKNGDIQSMIQRP